MGGLFCRLWTLYQASIPNYPVAPKKKKVVIKPQEVASQEPQAADANPQADAQPDVVPAKAGKSTAKGKQPKSKSKRSQSKSRSNRSQSKSRSKKFKPQMLNQARSKRKQSPRPKISRPKKVPARRSPARRSPARRSQARSNPERNQRRSRNKVLRRPSSTEGMRQRRSAHRRR